MIINFTTINISGYSNFILGLKKGYGKTQYTNCKWGLTDDWLEVYENRADRLSNNLRLNEISVLTFFPILLQNKVKPIRNSCKSNLWLKGTVIQIEKAMINDRLRFSKVSWKFRIPTIYNFAVIYPWN